MTYKIVKQPKAWWPVTFAGVTEDGAIIENKFEMRFRLLDEDEQLDIERKFAAMGERDDADQLRPSAVSAELVMQIAEDWRGVTEDDGSEAGRALPFTQDNVATLMKVPNCFIGVGDAYRACRAGQPGKRRGN